MKLFFAKNREAPPSRTPLVPESAAKLTKLGIELIIETGIGQSIHRVDADYEAAGATVISDTDAALAEADVVVRIDKPTADAIAKQRANSLHISYLDPFNSLDLVDAFLKANVDAVSLEMIPRTTLAQKMDVLSSQASIAGYAAVMLAADRIDQIFPMMMTPAGTIPPARVFVIGAGVAGLQAIATAKRLGARVEAFDTRPVVAEQVESLGARFVKIDLGETGQTKDGYAKALTEEQIEKQRTGMAKHCASADVVITTAQLFGRPAPRIITKEMVAGMKPGSVIVDMAVESGGNVAGSAVGEEVVINGVRILGLGDLPGRMPVDASAMFSSNVTNFIEHFWDKEASELKLDPEDEIVKGCLITHGGQIVNTTIKKLAEKE